MGGIFIAAMSSFAALSTAFGFQILSTRREIKRTAALDEERQELLKTRLEKSMRTLTIRWVLSFLCGVVGTAMGSFVRENKAEEGIWLWMGAGLSVGFLSIFFLSLMIVEYRHLLQFASELEERAREVKRNREWAERSGKIQKR